MLLPMSIASGDKPSDGAILERSKRLCNGLMYTIEIQVRRIKSSEPEDDRFPLRQWMDFQFLIVALSRLRRTTRLADKVPFVKAQIESAINEFDQALPFLKKMRDVAEHIDDYAVDTVPKRGHQEVSRKDLEVGQTDFTNFSWLGYTVNIDDTVGVAQNLFEHLRSAVRTYAESNPASGA